MAKQRWRPPLSKQTSEQRTVLQRTRGFLNKLQLQPNDQEELLTLTTTRPQIWTKTERVLLNGLLFDDFSPLQDTSDWLLRDGLHHIDTHRLIKRTETCSIHSTPIDGAICFHLYVFVFYL